MVKLSKLIELCIYLDKFAFTIFKITGTTPPTSNSQSSTTRKSASRPIVPVTPI